MGSFWGHIDEGIFFIIIALWWTFHACHQFIKSQQNGKEMKPRISYSLHCKRDIPVETIFKILFPLGGFLAEFFDGGVPLLDENGNFRKLVYAQHMTIYGIFVLHAVLDLLTWAGVPMAPGVAHVSAALSFVWYGVAFHYHAQMHGKELLETVVHVIPMTVRALAILLVFRSSVDMPAIRYGVAFHYHSQMHGKEPLETIVHVVPISAMMVTAVAILLELWWRRGVWTMLTRAYGVLTLGTWFSHVAFMLYEHDKFPGGGSSGWDRSDIRNVQYARASFGLHLLFNMGLMLLCYVITYLVMRMRGKLHIHVTYSTESDDVLGLRKLPYSDGADASLLANGVN